MSDMGRCRTCRAHIVWAITASGRSIPLDPDPVEPATHGALALVGTRALGRGDAVARVAEMFTMPDVDAAPAVDEYPWHVAHFATCQKPNRKDQP